MDTILKQFIKLFKVVQIYCINNRKLFNTSGLFCK